MKQRGLSSQFSSSPVAVAVVLSLALGSGLSNADPGLTADWRETSQPLSDEEIVALFSDVLDQATVLDSPGTTAVNRWYRDGRLVSEWRHGDRRGRLAGRWYAENNQRCVMVEADDGAVGEPRCGAIYQRGTIVVSLNPDGSEHGLHALSPLPAEVR